MSRVRRIGLSKISSSSKDDDAHASVDIVFVHGLFGHPYDTWTCKSSSRPFSSSILNRRDVLEDPTSIRGNTPSPQKTWAFWRRKRNCDVVPSTTSPLISDLKEETDATQDEVGTSSRSQRHIFWPGDLLPVALPDARVFTWGYDANVTSVFSFASQSTVSQHAKQLLADLTAARTTPAQKKRPLVFVVHSLGGIVLKDALVFSSMTRTYLKEIWPAVVGVCFLGTPHRGSTTASLGKIAFQISRMAYTQPNIELLRTLERNSAVLERISDGFAAMLVDGQIQVQCFRETLPTKGVMIVEPYSSIIGDGREVVGEIPANHRNMTKFASSNDVGFTRILAVLQRWLSDPLFLSLQEKDEARRCLTSLEIKETEFRSATIQDSFRGTCDWIFGETVPFSQWLRAKHRNSTFWIQGKPGSGKSTAMKYAMQHVRTKSFLQQSSPGDWLISGFFFYDRGSEIQKSTRGLLFQLLHSLLTKRPELARYVLPIYVNEVSIRSPNPDGQRVFDELNLARLNPYSESAITEERKRWTVDRLQAALLAIIRQNTLPLDLCLFIDALDEHTGSRVEMLKLLDNLVSSSDPKVVQVKLCLASRPETQFIDWLQDHPGFKIHDHTAGDIMLYARGRIRMELSLRHVEEKTEFIEVILARISRLAQGVFIWVRLVMDELVQGIQEGDNVEELNDILEDIPVELEDIYTRAVLRMAARRKPEKMKAKCNFEAYAMYQIALCARSPLDISRFMEVTGYVMQCLFTKHISDRSPGHVIGNDGRHREADFKYVSAKVRDETDDLLPISYGSSRELERRLTSRGGGLLEIVSGKVQYIHQTAKEWIVKAISTSRLLLNQPAALAGVTGHEMLLLFHHAKSTDNVRKEIPLLLYYMWHLETISGKSRAHLVQNLAAKPDFHTFWYDLTTWDDLSLAWRGNFSTEIPDYHEPNVNLVYLVTVCHLNLCLQDIMVALPDDFKRKNAVTFLMIAIQSVIKGWPDSRSVGRTEILETVLAQCQPDNQAMMGALVEANFFSVKTLPTSKDPAVGSGSIEAAYGKIMRTFLRAGLDPNASRFHDKMTSTLLHRAVGIIHNGMIEVVGALLDYHADVGAEDKSGRTPLDIARKLGHHEVFKLLKQASLNDAAALEGASDDDNSADAASFETAMS